MIFYKKHLFFPQQIGSVLVKKFAISPETATFTVGKPSVRMGRPWASRGRKRAAFCPLAPPFPLRPVRLLGKGSGTSCQPHFAGRVPGRFFPHRAAGWLAPRDRGNPLVFLTILPTGQPMFISSISASEYSIAIGAACAIISGSWPNICAAKGRQAGRL